MKWTLVTIITASEDYESIDDLRENAYNVYRVARDKGWLHRLGLPKKKRQGRPRKWKFTKVMKEAKKFESRGEFATKSNVAYEVACANDWLDLLPLPAVAPRKWTEKRLTDEAGRFASSGDFRRLSRSAYQTAWSQGLLEELFPG